MASGSFGASGRARPLRPRFRVVPKPGGGICTLVELDPAGDESYRGAVTPVAGRIERSLGPEVFAIRMSPARSRATSPRWAEARARWRRAVRAAIDDATAGTSFAVADVFDCYASITPSTLESLLGPESTDALAILRRLHDEGVRGLPIGPTASGVLANAALTELDRAVRTAGARHARWVDDLFVWGSPAEVRRALDALRAGGRRLGLSLHEEKTRTLADRSEAASVALGGRDSSIIAAR